MSAKQATQPKAGVNGDGKAPDPLAAAIAYEADIAETAINVRDGKTALTPELFIELLPLLRKPIPPGFIVTTEATKGKPYPSTGIKSLQVQINRLDAVFTPLNWSWHTEWSDDGRLADVVVNVWAEGPEGREALVTRRAKGGVNQASTEGNLRKGSETNAAKLAFARLGVGWEIYVGATDFDPDVDPDAAKEQAEIGAEAPRKLTEEQAEKAAQAIKDAGITDEALGHKLRSFGVKALTDLTYEQGFALKTWIEERAAAKGGES